MVASVSWQIKFQVFMFLDILKPRNQETPRFLRLEFSSNIILLWKYVNIEAGQGAAMRRQWFGRAYCIYPERRHRPFGNVWQTPMSSHYVPQHYEWKLVVKNKWFMHHPRVYKPFYTTAYFLVMLHFIHCGSYLHCFWFHSLMWFQWFYIQLVSIEFQGFHKLTSDRAELH